MDDDIIRILVATDNHLGFLGKDPVRCYDSFAAFEEVLFTATKEKADFVLLAGDLFHDNKPSRKTLHSTFDIIRKYSTGIDPVYIEIMNNQEEIFKNREKRVNYENPYESISLPIFAIHGNHDDPSREGISDPLSALDLFSVSNLVNYFGKADQVDDIEITPILIRKGGTNIALYGLGAIRDERLNRMWAMKKVKFIKPTTDQGMFLNIFVLHQNRDYGRGAKNCIHESMIPEWMDIVIWGNEHEAVPVLVESLVGTFRIFQPGSSVATSFSEGESSKYPKHMGLLEIRADLKFRLEPKIFTQIRPFIYNELTLSTVPGLEAHATKIESEIISVLSHKVKQMIKEGRKLIVQNPVNKDALFNIREPNKVLIKLRVENTGYPNIPPHRFGTEFMADVGNPSDILSFHKVRKFKDHPTVGAGDRSTMREFDEAVESGGIASIKVEDLVREQLLSGSGGCKHLSLLTAEDLSLALEEFVMKKIPSAISDAVEKSLQNTQQSLNQNKNLITVENIVNSVMELKSNQPSAAVVTSTRVAAASKAPANNISQAKKKSTARKESKGDSDGDSGDSDKDSDKDMDVQVEDAHIANAKKSKSTKATTALQSRSSRAAKSQAKQKLSVDDGSDSDDINDSDSDDVRAVQDDDDDDDASSIETNRKKQSKGSSSKPSKSTSASASSSSSSLTKASRAPAGGRGAAARGGRGRGGRAMQSDMSEALVMSPQKSTTGPQKRKKEVVTIIDDDDDDDQFPPTSSSIKPPTAFSSNRKKIVDVVDSGSDEESSSIAMSSTSQALKKRKANLDSWR